MPRADLEQLLGDAPFRPVGRRMVRIVLLVAAFCALTAIALQTLYGVRTARSVADARIQDITQTRLPVLSAALWDIEPHLVRGQVDSIGALPQIAGVRLVTAAGIEFTAGRLPPLVTNADARLDVMPPSTRMAPLGQLYLNFDHQYVVRRVLLDMTVTASLIVVFTGLLCFLLIRFLRAEISDPLQRLLLHVNSMSPDALGIPYSSGRADRAWHDELDQLAQGFTRLHTSIARYVEERNFAEARLAEERDQLEAKVVERTHDLEAARNKADQASRSKSEFLANMSHEIRTPINAIAGFTALALRTGLTPKQADYLEKINAATRGLLRIINDLLDFSKIEAGHLDMEYVPFPLSEVLETAVSYVGAQAERKGLELLVQVAPDVPTQWIGDPLRLGQVLLNLCSNAVKFTEQGEVEVRVALQTREEDRARLLFSVRDTGIGLSPEQAGKLFQAFTQADTSTTRRFGGTGLGLVISQRLVGMMKGSIWLESRVGVGTTFYFEVELGIGAGGGMLAQPDLPSALRGQPALVVDDNANARQILSGQLNALGLIPHAVDSGAAALAELRRASAAGQHYPVVLMDWKMPGMDGLETTRVIRSDRSIAGTPVIIMVTAYAREQVINASDDARLLDNILLKPVTASLLVDTLGRLGDTAGLDVPAAHPGLQHEQRAALFQRRLAGIRLLVVEDNPVNQQLARELLEMEGAQVTVAGNGRVALDLIEQRGIGQFDAVLLDLQMPEMDGYETARRIRALPNNAGLPLLAMTAHAMSEERERCLALGMQDHISKPIDPELMVLKLTRWIAADRLRRGVVVPMPTPVPVSAAVPAWKQQAQQQMQPGPLAGIDMQAALRRCEGNAELLAKLLQLFSQHYGGAAAQMSSLCASDNMHEAWQLAHTVKGAAANLAMHELAAVAGQLEDMLKHMAETKIAGTT